MSQENHPPGVLEETPGGGVTSMPTPKPHGPAKPVPVPLAFHIEQGPQDHRMTAAQKSESPRSSSDHQESLQCLHCQITFADLQFKQRHVKRHHPEEHVHPTSKEVFFVCFTCSETFPTARHLFSHQRSHQPKKQPTLEDLHPVCAPPLFCCEECGRSFNQASNYRRHALVHLGQRPYQYSYWGKKPCQCVDCGIVFRTAADLRLHQRIHSAAQIHKLPPLDGDEGHYQCTECGQHFFHESGLHEHYINHARGEHSHTTLAFLWKKSGTPSREPP